MYNLTELHPPQTSYGPWKILGAHVHKTTYGSWIDTALYVMFLIWANPLQGPLEGLGHESRDFFWALKQLE